MKDTYIKQVFNNFGKDDTQNIFTPPELCREMLSQIEFKGSEKVLVLYNLEFALILNKEFGLPASNIYIYTNSKTKQVFSKYGFEVLYFEDTLGIKNIDMKFDIVVGNPPYNASIAQKKLWPSFVEIAFKHLHKNGYFVFVIPSIWVKRDGIKIKRATKIFNTIQLNVINLDVNKYFPHIGEEICYVLAQNSIRNSVTKFIKENQVKEIEYQGQPVSFSKNEELKFLIYKKFLSHPNKFSKVKTKDFSNDYKKQELFDLGLLKKSPTTQYNIPVYFTASQTFYTKPEYINFGWRLILSFSGHYFVPGKEEKYMPVVENMGVSSGGFALEVKNKVEGLNARSIFSSKLFRFYIDTEKTGGFNTGITKLPLLDYSKSWTDQEIYEYFGLTQEEINLIESTIK